MGAEKKAEVARTEALRKLREEAALTPFKTAAAGVAHAAAEARKAAGEAYRLNEEAHKMPEDKPHELQMKAVYVQREADSATFQASEAAKLAGTPPFAPPLACKPAAAPKEQMQVAADNASAAEQWAAAAAAVAQRRLAHAEAVRRLAEARAKEAEKHSPAKERTAAVRANVQLGMLCAGRPPIIPSPPTMHSLGRTSSETLRPWHAN